MTQYDNTDSGVLFKNDRKESDRHPDYTGKINVNGTDMRLAAWIKTGNKGKFMSLKVSELQQAQAAPVQAKSAPVQDDFEDDIPW